MWYNIITMPEEQKPKSLRNQVEELKLFTPKQRRELISMKAQKEGIFKEVKNIEDKFGRYAINSDCTLRYYNQILQDALKNTVPTTVPNRYKREQLEQSIEIFNDYAKLLGYYLMFEGAVSKPVSGRTEVIAREEKIVREFSHNGVLIKSRAKLISDIKREISSISELKGEKRAIHLEAYRYGGDENFLVAYIKLKNGETGILIYLLDADSLSQANFAGCGDVLLAQSAETLVNITAQLNNDIRSSLIKQKDTKFDFDIMEQVDSYIKENAYDYIKQQTKRYRCAYAAAKGEVAEVRNAGVHFEPDEVFYPNPTHEEDWENKIKKNLMDKEIFEGGTIIFAKELERSYQKLLSKYPSTSLEEVYKNMSDQDIVKDILQEDLDSGKIEILENQANYLSFMFNSLEFIDRVLQNHGLQDQTMPFYKTMMNLTYDLGYDPLLKCFSLGLNSTRLLENGGVICRSFGENKPKAVNYSHGDGNDFIRKAAEGIMNSFWGSPLFSKELWPYVDYSRVGPCPVIQVKNTVKSAPPHIREKIRLGVENLKSPIKVVVDYEGYKVKYPIVANIHYNMRELQEDAFKAGVDINYYDQMKAGEKWVDFVIEDFSDLSEDELDKFLSVLENYNYNVFKKPDQDNFNPFLRKDLPNIKSFNVAELYFWWETFKNNRAGSYATLAMKIIPEKIESLKKSGSQNSTKIHNLVELLSFFERRLERRQIESASN
jgi:hypothetical protein